MCRALFFRWFAFPDPVQEGSLNDFAPCRGIESAVSCAERDAERGVWKCSGRSSRRALRGVVGNFWWRVRRLRI
jgi:hypothetical protein